MVRPSLSVKPESETSVFTLLAGASAATSTHEVRGVRGVGSPDVPLASLSASASVTMPEQSTPNAARTASTTRLSNSSTSREGAFLALPGIGAMMSLSRGTGNGGFSREMEWFSPALPRRR